MLYAAPCSIKHSTTSSLCVFIYLATIDAPILPCKMYPIIYTESVSSFPAISHNSNQKRICPIIPEKLTPYTLPDVPHCQEDILYSLMYKMLSSHK